MNNFEYLFEVSQKGASFVSCWTMLQDWGSMLGGFGEHFWWSWASFWEVFGVLASSLLKPWQKIDEHKLIAETLADPLTGKTSPHILRPPNLPRHCAECGVCHLGSTRCLRAPERFRRVRWSFQIQCCTELLV